MYRINAIDRTRCLLRLHARPGGAGNLLAVSVTVVQAFSHALRSMRKGDFFMGSNEKRQVAADHRVGQRFGDYVVEDQIGRGGMGVVFRARHVVSGQIVALKLMAPDLADNATFRERFIREAEAGPHLGHPNIVSVFESGDADGELFIAMELIEGTDLKGLIQQEGPLEPKRTLSLFQQAASALDAAHESGMVHRDVKPQNILVISRKTPEDTDHVFLTDFGLVRPLSSETSASRTGQVFGSVAYMAPELIEGIPADGRADVYALGCVLYECLTGKVPFERDNEVSTVWAHIHEDPPMVTDTRGDLPGGLNDVVFKAMAKHPDDRYLTCGEFITELELGLGRKLSSLRSKHVRPLVARIPRRKTEREVWAPNFFPELSRVRSATRERFDWRKGVALAVAVALLSAIQVGREGGLPQAVADVADAADSVVGAIVDREPESDVDDQIAEKDKARSKTSSPRTISASDRKELKALLPAADPTPSTEGNGSSGEAPEIAGGAGKIAWAKGVPWDQDSALGGGTVGESDIWVMDADGSNQIRLTTAPELEVWPSWSPDGSYIAYVVLGPQTRSGGPQDLWVMDADGKNQRDLGLCPGVDRCGKLAWSPDGRRVAFAQGKDLFVADLATGTRELLVSGEIEGVTPPVPGGGRGSGPTWSPDGKSLAFTCGDELCVVAVDGGKPRVIGGALADPDWTPAGGLVGEYWSGANASPDLVIHWLNGTGRRRLIRGSEYPGRARHPSWAPDGGAIVYSDEASLFRVNADGSGRVRLTSGSRDLTPDWGPSQ